MSDILSKILSVALLLNLSCNQSEKTTDNWVTLLNDENIKAWTIKMGSQPVNQDSLSAFKFENNILKIYDEKVSSEPQIGHIFYQNIYSNFRLKFEYRFTGRSFKDHDAWPEQYGGIIFHSQSPESMGFKQDYPICLEFQLLGGFNSGDRPTGNVCTIGTTVETNGIVNPNHCINSNSPTFSGDEWVKAELEVWNDSLVRHFINDQLVLEYRNLKIGGGFVSESFDWEKGNVPDKEEWIKRANTRLSTGYIGIQAHDSMEIRNMEILEQQHN